jgi:prepilin-type N-terminal cleavage/methylation domain-containing protein
MKIPSIHNGFSLLELLIAIVISSFIILGLSRLYSASLWSYSLQEQMSEMNQNAKFTIKELSDILQQAGADCAEVNSDTLDRDTITKFSNDTLIIKVNPRGGLFIFSVKTPFGAAATCSLAVPNANNFRYASLLGQVPCPTAPTSRKVRTYSLSGINSTSNKICISGGAVTDTFFVGDAIYSFERQRYYRNGTNVCLNNDTNVIAENIDSLGFIFYNRSGTAIASTSSTLWVDSWSVKITVRATTAVPDNRYNGYSDHRRRVLLTYTLRMKNKV